MTKRISKISTAKGAFAVSPRLIAQCLDQVAKACERDVVEGILANAQRLSIQVVIDAATAKLDFLAPPLRMRRTAAAKEVHTRSSEWGPEVPNTHPHAKPAAMALQSGGIVVHVENAQYRGCTFSGYIELSGEAPFFSTPKGLRAMTKILWFGHQLPTRDPGILLANAVVTEVPYYSGPVISNLAA